VARSTPRAATAASATSQLVDVLLPADRYDCKVGERQGDQDEVEGVSKTGMMLSLLFIWCGERRGTHDTTACALREIGAYKGVCDESLLCLEASSLSEAIIDFCLRADWTPSQIAVGD